MLFWHFIFYLYLCIVIKKWYIKFMAKNNSNLHGAKKAKLAKETLLITWQNISMMSMQTNYGFTSVL